MRTFCQNVVKGESKFAVALTVYLSAAVCRSVPVTVTNSTLSLWRTTGKMKNRAYNARVEMSGERA